MFVPKKATIIAKFAFLSYFLIKEDNMMNNAKCVLLAASFAFALAFTISCSSDEGGSSEQSYDYCIMANNTCLAGPFTASNCNGQVSNSCPNNSNPGGGSSTPSSSSAYVAPSSSSAQQVANAVVITLTYWETKETDGLFGTDKDLDPKIHFVVTATKSGTTVSADATDPLLNADNIGQSWSGSRRSSPISFSASADKLQIQAVVKEKDPTIDDDISPGYYAEFPLPIYVGRSGSQTLDYGSGKSKVSFSYQFVKQ